MFFALSIQFGFIKMKAFEGNLTCHPIITFLMFSDYYVTFLMFSDYYGIIL